MAKRHPDESLRLLCVFALGTVLLNALLACGWLVSAMLQGHWDWVLLHAGKVALITGWVGYRWLSLARRRYLITRPWQAGSAQLAKTGLQRIAFVTAFVWLLSIVWIVFVQGLSWALLTNGFLLACQLTVLISFIAIDVINFTVLEKPELDVGESDVSTHTY